MDAIQFGRWIQNCRRKCGFPSQRALVAKVQQDRVLAETGISEAFLARLEAGLLAHPFRGKVRDNVLALAELLCTSPRELTAYLRAAELDDLDVGQQARIEQLRRRLSPRKKQSRLPLPPRPSRLFGRQPVVEELLDKLVTLDTGLYLITGMPGVGKSALAAEIAHRLAAQDSGRAQAFPDGVVAFRCRGYRGKAGVLSLLEDIVSVFGASEPARIVEEEFKSAARDVDTALTRTMMQVRLALANMSVFLLLDDVEATFPLREALGVILSGDYSSIQEANKRPAQRVVFVTTSYRFNPAIACHSLHLEPLSPADALAYFTSHLDHSLQNDELEYARELCAAAGFLPLALEGLVTLNTNGVPLSLLCAILSENPGLALLDSGQELRARLDEALAFLNISAQQSFALLAALGVTSFQLEGAAALRASPPPFVDPRLANRTWSATPAMDANNGTRSQMAMTALELGQLVRHSLIELAPENVGMIKASSGDFGSLPDQAERRYTLHPVLRTYALERLNRLEPAEIEAARGKSLAYALRYLEQHKDHNRWLLAERDFLFVAFKDALRNDQFAEAVRFVDALAPISCRLGRSEDGTHLFLWGIQACQQLHDPTLEQRFMNHLGVLYSLQGAFADARQVWEEALAMNAALSRPLQNWQPLLRLANLSHLHGEEEAAIHAVETYLHYSRDSASPLKHAVARTHLALYKRLQEKREDAYHQVSSGLDLLSNVALSEEPTRIATVQDYVGLSIQVERARIREDYPASRRYSAALSTFLREEEEPYELAEVLSEQARFALQQGMWEDTRDLASAMRQAAEEVKSSYFRQRSLQFLEAVKVG